MRAHIDNGGSENKATDGSTRIGKQTADPAEATAAAPLAAGAAAAAVAGTAADAALHHTTGSRPTAKQATQSQAAGKPVPNAANAEAAAVATRASESKVSGKAGATPPKTAAVQAPAPAERAAHQEAESRSRGGDAGSGSPGSGDPGKGQTAKGHAGEKAAAGPNAQAFTPASAKDGGKGHDSSTSPATAAANVAGVASGLSSSAAAHAGSAKPSSTGEFGTAAVTAQRDAPVAGAPGASATGANGGISAVHNAELIGKASHAQMRIRMDTEQLGPLELRTWAAGNRVTTVISTQRPETHWLLSSGVGTLHQALNDHNLQVERIDVVWNPAGNGGGQAGGSATGGGTDGNRQGAPQRWSGTAIAEAGASASEEAATSSATLPYLEGRLSVRV